MRVTEIVRLATDKYAEGPTGKVIAVSGPRSGHVTVAWLDGKTTDHPHDQLILVSSPFRREHVAP